MQTRFKLARKVAFLVVLIMANLLVFQNCAQPKGQQAAVSDALSLMSDSGPKVDGRCGGVVETCDAGTYLSLPDSGTQSVWQCSGSGGGVDTICTLPFTASQINGQCDPNKVNSCLKGKFIDQTDSSTFYYWQCQGFNSGTTDSCSRSKSISASAVNGRCGTSLNTCLDNTTFRDEVDTSTNKIWSCDGLNGGTGALCNIAIGTGSSAACGTMVNTCASGSTFMDVADSADFYIWKCSATDGTFASCTQPKPQCSVNVQPVTHIGDNYTYTLTVSSGFLPPSVTVKIYGTKSALDGSGTVPDATGSSNDTVSLPTINGGKNISYTFPNNTDLSIKYQGGTYAGKYTRYFKILDSNNVELCTTNTVVQSLTPACGLNVSAPDITTQQSYSLSYDLPAANEKPLGATAANVFWYGTKTDASMVTTNDLTGTTFDAATPATKTFNPPTSNSVVGTYVRRFIAKSSTGVELCRSRDVSYRIINSPAPIVTMAAAPGITNGRSYVTLKGSNFSLFGDNMIISNDCPTVVNNVNMLVKNYDSTDSAGATGLREIQFSYPAPPSPMNCTFSVKRPLDNAMSTPVAVLLAGLGATPGTGLKGDYYDGINFNSFKTSRTDATVNFDFGAGPNNVGQTTQYSVRWTGKIRAEKSETYTFYTQSDDGVRLFVDGVLIIDNFTDHASMTDQGTQSFTWAKDSMHTVTLEYYQNDGVANIALSWSSATTATQIIPQQFLYPQ